MPSTDEIVDHLAGNYTPQALAKAILRKANDADLEPESEVEVRELIQPVMQCFTASSMPGGLPSILREMAGYIKEIEDQGEGIVVHAIQVNWLEQGMRNGGSAWEVMVIHD